MIARESATITVPGRDPNEGRGVGKFYDEKKGGVALGVPDSKLLAWGSWTQAD